MTAEDEVRKASQGFYAAVNRMLNGDSSSMADVWLQDPAVTALHPIGGRAVGWDTVNDSFAQVAKMAANGKVELTDQLIRVAGDVAYEIGVEHGQMTLAGHDVEGEIRVTNIYRRQDGAWKMVHHHTDTAPAMLEVLKRLPG